MEFFEAMVLVIVEVLAARCEARLVEWQGSLLLVVGKNKPTRRCTGRISGMGHQ